MCNPFDYAKPKKDRPKESSLVNAIMRRLKALPSSWWIKFHGTGFSFAGVPDIIGCVRGRMVCFEVKRVGNKPTRIQRHIHERIRNSGGVVAVVHNAAEALTVLEQHDLHRGDD